MKSLKYILILSVVLFSNFEIAYGAENDYGIVKAWFNGKNATVKGVELKLGEPAEIKVEVTSKINGTVALELTEPGVTKAFKVTGQSKLDESIVNYDVITGWSKIYTWTITPNGAWKNGNAPLNIFVQFDKIVNGEIKGDKTIQFTIANPYILDEQYTGAATTPETTASRAGTQAKEAPFLPVIFTVSALLLAWRWGR
ncbi:MAG: sarcinarray family MAST domain-containing protein [Candidatus Methanoperedens sp.]|nr:sarcinarray family MAST domain-containing protein [Candidatus Methanoperedens sp.]